MLVTGIGADFAMRRLDAGLGAVRAYRCAIGLPALNRLSWICTAYRPARPLPRTYFSRPRRAAAINQRAGGLLGQGWVLCSGLGRDRGALGAHRLMGIALPSVARAGGTRRQAQRAGAAQQAGRGAPRSVGSGVLQCPSAGWSEHTRLPTAPVARHATGTLVPQCDIPITSDRVRAGRDRKGQRARQSEGSRNTAPTLSAGFEAGLSVDSGVHQHHWHEFPQPLRETPSSTAGIRAETQYAVGRDRLGAHAATEISLPDCDPQRPLRAGREPARRPALGDQHRADQRPYPAGCALTRARPPAPLLPGSFGLDE